MPDWHIDAHPQSAKEPEDFAEDLVTGYATGHTSAAHVSGLIGNHCFARCMTNHNILLYFQS